MEACPGCIPDHVGISVFAGGRNFPVCCCSKFPRPAAFIWGYYYRSYVSDSDFLSAGDSAGLGKDYC